MDTSVFQTKTEVLQLMLTWQCVFVCLFFFWFREFKKIRRIIRRGMEKAKKNITKKKRGCALIVRNTLFFYK
jgi:hypothetical protein